MQCNIDIPQHPFLRSIGLTERSLDYFVRFIELESDERGIINILFSFVDPISGKIGHKLKMNSEFERLVHYDVNIAGIMWTSDRLLHIVSKVIVFNEPLEALAYIELNGPIDCFTSIVVLPKTFTSCHVEMVRAYYPSARPICCFGNGQLAALQDAQYYLLYTNRDKKVKISYGLQGIKVVNDRGKSKYYEHFSLRGLVRDFFGGRYGKGPTTQKPTLKQKSFKKILCDRKPSP